MRTDSEGFELAYDLKNQPEFRDVPIIMLSGFLERVRIEGPDRFAQIEDQEWPAVWFFEKPVETKKLISKIQAVLEEKANAKA